MSQTHDNIRPVIFIAFLLSVAGSIMYLITNDNYNSIDFGQIRNLKREQINNQLSALQMRQISDSHIVKPLKDNSIYHQFELKNGLKVLVVANENQQQDEIAISVKAGLIDEKIVGLAETCNRVLSKDLSYVSKLSSSHFYGKSDDFRETLQSFRKSLESMDAVEIERSSGQGDRWMELLEVSRGDKKSVDEVEDGELRREMKEFVESNYGGSKMGVVVISRKSINAIEKWVKKESGLDREMGWSEGGQRKANLDEFKHKVLKYESDSKSVCMMTQVGVEAALFLEDVLKSKHTDSLYHQLKASNLISNLQIKNELLDSQTYLLSLEFISPADPDQVIALTQQYLRQLSSQFFDDQQPTPYLSSLFSQYSLRASMDFHYYSSSFDLLRLSNSFLQLARPYDQLYPQFSPNSIRQALQFENYIIAQTTPQELLTANSYYHFKYANLPYIEKDATNEVNQFSGPPLMQYFPEEFPELINLCHKQGDFYAYEERRFRSFRQCDRAQKEWDSKEAVELLRTASASVWWKLDRSMRTPDVYVNLKVKVEPSVRRELFSAWVLEQLVGGAQERMPPHVEIKALNGQYMEIELLGVTSTIKKYWAKLMSCLTPKEKSMFLEVDGADLSSIKEKVLDEMKQSERHVEMLLFSKYQSRRQKEKELASIEEKNLAEYQEEVARNGRYEVRFVGNIMQSEAREMSEMLSEFGNNASRLSEQKVIKVGNSKVTYHVKGQKHFTRYFQWDRLDAESVRQFEYIATFLKEDERVVWLGCVRGVELRGKERDEVEAKVAALKARVASGTSERVRWGSLRVEGKRRMRKKEVMAALSRLLERGFVEVEAGESEDELRAVRARVLQEGVMVCQE